MPEPVGSIEVFHGVRFGGSCRAERSAIIVESYDAARRLRRRAASRADTSAKFSWRRLARRSGSVLPTMSYGGDGDDRAGTDGGASIPPRRWRVADQGDGIELEIAGSKGGSGRTRRPRAIEAVIRALKRTRDGPSGICPGLWWRRSGRLPTRGRRGWRRWVREGCASIRSPV